VGLCTACRGVQAVVTIFARPAMLTPELRAALDTMPVPPPRGALHLAAGRHAMRAQGGVVSVETRESELLIEIALPVAR
jgi:hypothetical protein